MRLADMINLPALLKAEHAKPDHTTLPLMIASATMPAWHFGLDNVSQGAALLAPILGVFLVLVKIAAIILNDLYKPLALRVKNTSPAKKTNAKVKYGKRKSSPGKRRTKLA